MEGLTLGKSKSPERLLHHTVWYYKRRKGSSLLERIFCRECGASFPSSSSMKSRHPEDEYIIAKEIKHTQVRKK